MPRTQNTRLATILAAILTHGTLIGYVAGAQELTAWSNHRELVQWVHDEDGKITPDGVEQLWDGTRPYIRVNWRNSKIFYSDLSGLNGTDREQPLPIFDARKYNAVKVTVRGHGFDAIAASWLDTAYDGEGMPYLSLPQRLNQSSAWQELLFRFSDSALYQQQPMALLAFMPSLAYADAVAGLVALLQGTNQAIQQLSPDAYMDVARIALVHVDESIPNPVVQDFEPKLARKGDEITIYGSGFGELPAWNVVEVNNERVWIAGGDNHHLRVQLRRMDNSSGPASCQKCAVVVLTRGGRKAAAPQALELLGNPYVIRIVGPDDQIATVSSVRGSVLPVEVRVLDLFNRALAGEKVTFEVSTGGTLSTTETSTGKDGIARTSLTVLDEPYPRAGIKVDARSGTAWGYLKVKLQ